MGVQPGILNPRRNIDTHGLRWNIKAHGSRGYIEHLVYSSAVSFNFCPWVLTIGADHRVNTCVMLLGGVLFLAHFDGMEIIFPASVNTNLHKRYVRSATALVLSIRMQLVYSVKW